MNKHEVVLGIDPVETGKSIRQLMKLHHYSAEDVANALCVSPQAVYKWCSGKTTPSLDNLSRLAKLLNMSTDRLIVRNKSDKLEREFTCLEDLRVVESTMRPITSIPIYSATPEEEDVVEETPKSMMVHVSQTLENGITCSGILYYTIPDGMEVFGVVEE